MARQFRGRVAPARGGLSTQRGQRFFRPRFEALESRSLLSATVITVDTFDDVVNAGDGLTSLREAVLAANASADDEEIQLAAGTYALTIQGAGENAAASGDLDILNNGSLRIIGAGAAATIINADGLVVGTEFQDNDRIFQVQGAKLQLDGLGLTGGQSIAGGTIANVGGELTITSSAISHGMAFSGAGIYNTSSGQVTILSSTISNNNALKGSGIYNDANGQVTIMGSLISENSNFSFGGAEGGGIFNGGTLIIRESTVSHNSATKGGGVYNFTISRLTIADCTLSENTATEFGRGGGIESLGQMTISDSSVTANTGMGISIGGTATITNTVVTDNSQSGILNTGRATITGNVVSGNTHGGINTGGTATIIDTIVSNNISYGISNSGTATITDSTISGNSPGNNGGGLINVGQVTITRTTLTNNMALGIGGGVYNTNNGTVTVISSTLSGNSAAFDGGGIYNSSGQVTVQHSTITGNRAGTDGNATRRGGGLFIAAGSVKLYHTIVAGNVRGVAPGGTPSDIENGSVDPASAYNLVGDPATAGGLLHGTNGNILGDGGGNLLPVGLILDPTLADNGGPTMTHALVADSPAINAGDPLFDPNATNPAVLFDQRGAGFDRVFDGRIDIGAFEFGSEFQNVVVGRHIFYNHSKFDGNSAEISLADSGAIAPDKHALIGAALAGFANVTSYSRGINGIMVDIAGPHPDITLDDFVFRVGNNNSFASWVPAPEPAAISVLAGQGVGGADRVEIVWTDGQIKNTYLQAIVAASSRTGLVHADEFFWGNRVGDSGTSTPATFFQTTSTDAAQVYATITGSAAIDNLRDYDRSGDVSSTDAAIVNSNIGTLVKIAVVPPPALSVPFALAIVVGVVPHTDPSATDARFRDPTATVNLIQERLRVETPSSNFIDRAKETRTSARRTTAEPWIDIYGSAGGEYAADGPL